MRIAYLVPVLLFSFAPAHAQKVVASGRPLMLYEAYSTNPDCSSAGSVVVRVAQGPEHGRVSVHPTGVFPKFPESNPRSACNRRRVAGMQATYVSQRGYTGPDHVVLEALFPAGQGRRITMSIRVM